MKSRYFFSVYRGMEVDFQFFVNVVIALLTFFGGWVLKSLSDRIKKNELGLNGLKTHHENDLKEARQKVNDLALSLPEKYVNKGDFENLVKVVHHRFDRIEEKLDSLNAK